MRRRRPLTTREKIGLAIFTAVAAADLVGLVLIRLRLWNP